MMMVMTVVIFSGCATVEYMFWRSERNFIMHHDDWVGEPWPRLLATWREPKYTRDLGPIMIGYEYYRNDQCNLLFEVDRKSQMIVGVRPVGRCRSGPGCLTVLGG